MAKINMKATPNKIIWDKNAKKDNSANDAWSKSVTQRTEAISKGEKGGAAAVTKSSAKSGASGGGLYKTIHNPTFDDAEIPKKKITGGNLSDSMFSKMHNPTFSSDYSGYKGYQSGKDGRRVFTPSSVLNNSRDLLSSKDAFGQSVNRRRFVPSSNIWDSSKSFKVKTNRDTVTSFDDYLIQMARTYREINENTKSPYERSKLVNKLLNENKDIIDTYNRTSGGKTFNIADISEQFDENAIRRKELDTRYYKTLNDYYKDISNPDFAKFSQSVNNDDIYTKSLSDKLKPGFNKNAFKTTMAHRVNKAFNSPVANREMYEGSVDTSVPFYSPETGAVTYYDMQNPDDAKLLYMKSEEKQIYNYQLAKYGQEAADKFLDYLSGTLDERYVKAYAKNREEFANKHKILGAGENIISQFRQPAAAIDAVSQTIDQNRAIKRGGAGYKPYNPYTQATLGVHEQNATEQGITRDMSGAGKTVTDFGLSLGQNVARLPLGTYGLPIMAAGVIGNTAVDAGMRGQTDAGKAAKLGAAYGAVEYATEKLPLEQLLRVMKSPPSTIRGFVTQILKNSATEFGEESISNIADNIADKIIMQDKSEYEAYKKNLISQGKTPEQAERETFNKFFIQDTFISGAQGAASGAILGTGAAALGTTVNNYNYTVNTGREYKSAGAEQDLINEGLRSSEDTSAYKYADKLQNKQNLSDWNVGRQVQKNTRAIDAENRQGEAFVDITGVKNETIDSLPHNANGAAVINLEQTKIQPLSQSGRINNENTEDADSAVSNTIISENNENVKRFSPSKSKVQISENRKTSKPETLTHEYTHILKQLAPEQFQRYEDYVNSVVRLSNMAYADNEISEETAAIVAEKLKPTAEQIQKVVSGDSTIADKAIDAIDLVSTKLKDKFGKTQQTRFNGQITNEQLRQARKLWNDVLKAAAESAVSNNGISDNKPKVKYSFAGENSKTADLEALKIAKQMEKDGADPETIWKETGWGRGLDGKWRYEIDDSKMKFKGSTSELQKLSDALDYEELYQAYPDIKDISIQEVKDPNFSGAYSEKDDIIYLNEDLTYAQKKATLAHELQHAIQKREGFARGGNLLIQGDDFYNTAGEIEAYDTKARVNMNSEERRTTFPDSMKKRDKPAIIFDRNNMNMIDLLADNEYRKAIEKGDMDKAGNTVRIYAKAKGYQMYEYDDNGTAKYIFRDGEGNEKSADTITYDDDGNIISLPRRFNNENSDIRFSLNENTEEHTPEQLKIIQEYEDAIDENLLDFVQYAKEHKNDNRTNVTLSEVSERGAKDIRNLTGIDVTGYEHNLKVNTINHIENRHGINGDADHSMADDNDIARIQYVLDNYDNVELLDETSREFKNKDNMQAPMIRYSKRIDGTYYAVEAVPDTKAHKLQIVTAYKNKAAQQVRDAQSPNAHVRNEPADTAYNNTVSQDSGNVKYSMNEGEYEWSTEEINEIVNSDMTDSEKRAALEERIRFIPRGDKKTPQDIVNNARVSGIKHLDNMFNAKESNYTEDDWTSYGEDFNIENMSRDMQQRLEDAEEHDRQQAKQNVRRDRRIWRDNMSEQDWENLMNGDEAQRQAQVQTRQTQQAQERDRQYAEQAINALMEQNGVTSPSELAPDTLSREESAKGRRVFRGAQTVHNIMSRAYTFVVDDMHPFFNFNKAYEKASGRTNYGKDNPYKLAINAKDASNRASYIVSDKMVDFDNNEIGKGLVETVTDGGITKETYKDFNKYLVAKHAVEWLNPDEHGTFKNVYNDARLDNMDVAQAIADDFERKHPEFKTTAENIYKWQRQLMKTWLVDTGVITQEQYNKFIEMYPNYVPFFREDNKFSSNGGSLGFANDGNPIKNAVGTMEQRILEPIENIMYNTASYVNYATKHSVMKSAVNLYDTLENDSENNILRQFWEEVYPINPEENNPQYFRTGDSQDFDIQDATQDENNTISQTLQNQLNIRNGVISYTDNGNTRYFRINDKDFFNVLDNAKAGRADGLLAILGSVSRIRAALITSWNPAFSLASNPARDFGTLILNSTDANKAKIARKAVASYKDIVKKSDAYKQYLSMGGQYSSVTTEGMNNMKQALQKLQGKDPNIVKRFFGQFPKMFNAYQTVSDAIEAAPRMGEFKSTLDKGYDFHEAFYRAKDVTTNFSRGGKLSKEMNAVSNFFNASVQGVDKFFRQAKNNPTSFAVGVSCLTAIGLLAWAWNTAGDDDEKDEAYENLSNYAKNNNYNFYIGKGKFISIPKARESAVLTTAIEAVLDKTLKDEDDRFKGFFSEYVLKQFIPDGSIIGISTINDLRANKDFKDSPIIPSALENLPNELQYDDSTSYLAKWLGSVTHQSPKKIDYIINSETGVVGKINKTYFTPKARQDKAAMFTFGASSTFNKDSLFSTDKVNMFYDNKDNAEKQANGYPNAENEYLSNRFSQSSKMLSILNQMYKEDSLSDKGRENRKAYVNFANANKDNPNGYSDEVYNKIKSLFDTDKAALSLPSISRDIKTKDGSYTINDAKTLLNYQKDLNFNVDEAYRKLYSDVSFTALPDVDKVSALNKAKSAAVNEVKQFYIDNQGNKRMFNSDAHTDISAPTSQETAAYTQKTKYHNKISGKIQTIADNLAAAVPDKADDYSAKSLTEFDIKSGKINGKSYDITGDVKNKVTEAAEDEYFSNIEKLMNNEVTVESIIGYTSKGNARTSTQADGTKVSLTGKLYNDDGTPRFDELVTAKILYNVKEAAKSNAINKYASEISGDDTIQKAEQETEPIKVSKSTGSKRKSSSSGRKSSGGSSKKSSGRNSYSVADILKSLETTAYASDLDSYTPSNYSSSTTSLSERKFRATDISSAPRYVSYGKRSYTLSDNLRTRYTQVFNRYYDGYKNLLSNDDFDISELLKNYDKGTRIGDLSQEEREHIMTEAKALADKNTQSKMQEEIEKNGTPKFEATA